MRVEKYVEFNTVVEIDVSIDEISNAIIEDREVSHRAMLRAVSNFHRYMKAMPDDILAETNEKQSELITLFLLELASRFKAMKRGILK